MGECWCEALIFNLWPNINKKRIFMGNLAKFFWQWSLGIHFQIK